MPCLIYDLLLWERCNMSFYRIKKAFLWFWHFTLRENRTLLWFWHFTKGKHWEGLYFPYFGGLYLHIGNYINHQNRVNRDPFYGFGTLPLGEIKEIGSLVMFALDKVTKPWKGFYFFYFGGLYLTKWQGMDYQNRENRDPFMVLALDL